MYFWFSLMSDAFYFTLLLPKQEHAFSSRCVSIYLEEMGVKKPKVTTQVYVFGTNFSELPLVLWFLS